MVNGGPNSQCCFLRFYQKWRYSCLIGMSPSCFVTESSKGIQFLFSNTITLCVLVFTPLFEWLACVRVYTCALFCMCVCVCARALALSFNGLFIVEGELKYGKTFFAVGGQPQYHILAQVGPVMVSVLWEADIGKAIPEPEILQGVHFSKQVFMEIFIYSEFLTLYMQHNQLWCLISDRFQQFFFIYCFECNIFHALLQICRTFAVSMGESFVSIAPYG